MTAVNASGEKTHFLRTISPLNPESLATFGKRLTTNRNSAYSPPKWAEGLLAGLPGFNTSQCSSGITATLSPTSGTSQGLKERTAKGETKEAEELFKRLKQYAFGEQSGTGSAPAPPCTQQASLEPIYGSGPATTYQHVFEQPGG